jgi:hypothetical protein
MGRRGREWVRENRTYDRLGAMVHGKLLEALAHPGSRGSRPAVDGGAG